MSRTKQLCRADNKDAGDGTNGSGCVAVPKHMIASSDVRAAYAVYSFSPTQQVVHELGIGRSSCGYILAVRGYPTLASNTQDETGRYIQHKVKTRRVDILFSIHSLLLQNPRV